jgi:uncharacterized protein YndB with AHSA1/START domain
MRDSVDLRAEPERVWQWLTGLAEHYTAWHPAHRDAVWERGQPNQVGSVLRVVEDLGGHREVLRFELTSVEPPHRYEYRFRGPISLLLPRGAFTVVPRDGGSRFVAGISYRFGWLTEHLFSRRSAQLRAHMHEEGENLRRILDG